MEEKTEQEKVQETTCIGHEHCLLYTSPSTRDT